MIGLSRDMEGVRVGHEKILVLESTWAEEPDEYLTDTSSSSQVYRALEVMASTQEHPITTVVRPLLAKRFARDLRGFTALPANTGGNNVIVLCGHGDLAEVDVGKRKKRVKHRRVLKAYDGDLDLDAEIKVAAEESSLERSIIILDSCFVGEAPKKFRRRCGALGVIAFREEVDWVDSSVFVLGLLLHFMEEGIFHMKRRSPVRPKRVLEAMTEGPYASLAEALGVTSAWA